MTGAGAEPDTTIRPAVESDLELIFELLRESAMEQGGLAKLCVDVNNLREDGFGATPRFFCLLVERGGEGFGLLLYFFIYSTWVSRKALYVEDLYVRPQFRRGGAGRALMNFAARLAHEQGCGYMQWMVLNRNEAAIRFYESIGARMLSEWSLQRAELNEGLEGG